VKLSRHFAGRDPPRLGLLKAATAPRLISFSGHSCAEAPNRCSGGGLKTRRLDMSEKSISRRGALSLLGLAAALGLAVPTTVLTPSDAEAQAQPAAPPPAAPATTPAPTTPAPTMTRRQQRHAARQQGREMRREARRTGRQLRREARHNARQMRREARRGIYMRSNTPTKQQ
jgi:hypothetical protein